MLLIGPLDDLTQTVLVEVTQSKRYKVDAAETVSQGVQKVSQTYYHLIVLNQNILKLQDVENVMRLHTVDRRVPIVIYSGISNVEMIQKINNIENIITLDKPFDRKGFWGVCSKLISGQKIKQKYFKRFATFENATLEKTSTGETLTGQMYNVSRGGACVEFVGGKLKIGDVVLITIPLNKMDKSYQFSAQVMWVKASTRTLNGGSAVGLRFINRDEHYRHLLQAL